MQTSELFKATLSNLPPIIFDNLSTHRGYVVKLQKLNDNTYFAPMDGKDNEHLVIYNNQGEATYITGMIDTTPEQLAKHHLIMPKYGISPGKYYFNLYINTESGNISISEPHTSRIDAESCAHDSEDEYSYYLGTVKLTLSK